MQATKVKVSLVRLFHTRKYGLESFEVVAFTYDDRELTNCFMSEEAARSFVVTQYGLSYINLEEKRTRQ